MYSIYINNILHEAIQENAAPFHILNYAHYGSATLKFVSLKTVYFIVYTGVLFVAVYS